MKKFLLVIWLALSAGFVCANEGHGGGGGGGSAELIALEPLVINLSAGHYIQFKPQLKLHDPKDMEQVRAYMPLVRFELIKSLIGKDVAEVQTVKFMGEYSEAAATLINKALDHKFIKEVFFDVWLVQ